MIRINDEMCSTNCPCDPSGAALGWNDLTADELTNTYETERLPNSFIFTGTAKTYADCITKAAELVAEATEAAEAVDPEAVDPEAVEPEAVDEETVEPVVEELTEAEDFEKFAGHFSGQGDFAVISEWIEWFETEYDCAGICHPALFFW